MQEGKVKPEKVPGTRHVADLGTKHLTNNTMWELIGSMAVRSRVGRSALAVKAIGEA